jgi:hypothetical protein
MPEGSARRPPVLADELPLALVERLGLVEDLLGNRELAEIVEPCGSEELVEVWAGEAEPHADGDRELAHAVEVREQVGLADRKALEKAAHGRVALQPAMVLLRVETLVRDRERAAHVAGLRGKHRRPEPGVTSNPSPRSESAADAAWTTLSTPSDARGTTTQNSAPPSL